MSTQLILQGVLARCTSACGELNKQRGEDMTLVSISDAMGGAPAANVHNFNLRVLVGSLFNTSNPQAFRMSPNIDNCKK